MNQSPEFKDSSFDEVDEIYSQEGFAGELQLARDAAVASLELTGVTRPSPLSLLLVQRVSPVEEELQPLNRIGRVLLRGIRPPYEAIVGHTSSDQFGVILPDSGIRESLLWIRGVVYKFFEPVAIGVASLRSSYSGRKFQEAESSSQLYDASRLGLAKALEKSTASGNTKIVALLRGGERSLTKKDFPRDLQRIVTLVHR